MVSHVSGVTQRDTLARHIRARAVVAGSGAVPSLFLELLRETETSSHYRYDMVTESTDKPANGRAPTRRGVLVKK